MNCVEKRKLISPSPFLFMQSSTNCICLWLCTLFYPKKLSGKLLNYWGLVKEYKPIEKWLPGMTIFSYCLFNQYKSVFDLWFCKNFFYRFFLWTHSVAFFNNSLLTSVTILCFRYFFSYIDRLFVYEIHWMSD